MRPDAAPPVRLAEYAPCAYACDEIRLDFRLSPGATRVRATSAFRRIAAAPAPLRLDGVNLKLISVAIDGAPLAAVAYAVDGEGLTLHDPPAAFTLDIETEIDPAGNTALEGLYLSGGRFCTQCEAEGFRKITYAQDRPDALSRYTVRIEADAASYPTLLSNGDLVEQGALEGGRHYALWRDPHPKPCYLFALVAGRFDTISDRFRTGSGRDVLLNIHVDPGDGPRAHYAMDALKRAMAWDECVFGREYDLSVFNIVAVRDFNFGAMENKGLNIFNSAYVLADAETATDLDFEAIESVVAHEYFHNWTGNRITLRDWFQLCLKEGLTVFRDQEFSADQRSRPVQRIKDVKRLRARQFPEDAGPLAHPVRPQSYQKIDNFYTATVYEKGAEVIRMLQALIGADAFARGMALYFDRCDGTAATVEDFIACFAEASGEDLSAFMSWYDQAGTPHVTARGDYDPTARRYRLTLRQHTPPTPGQTQKRALPIPLRVGFIGLDGAPLGEHALRLDAAEATFTFEGVAAAPVPAILRGFSAPVVLDDGLSEAERIAQMTHEPCAFTRWEAGQSLSRAALLARAEGREAPAAPLIAAFARELDRAGADPAFAALALRLPDVPELIQFSDAPDPDRLFAARSGLRREIAQALKPHLLALVAEAEPEAFSADAAAAGRRALTATALDLLGALAGEAEPAIVAAFDGARTMTQRMAALDALSQGPAAAFDRALDAFYARFHQNPLTLDKWFSVQAGAAREDAFARLAALQAHRDFSLSNPNRVRAVAMSFALRNPRDFHAADGAGYRFLAGVAAAVDAKNPAVAARLLGPFETWRRFDEGRQMQARAALQTMLTAPGLSPNAREILERTLG